MTDVILAAAAVLAALWLPYAVVLWWRFRSDRPRLTQEAAEARKWVEWHPSPLVHLAEPALPWLLPVARELACALNGLLWPVERLVRPFRHST